MQLFNLFGIFIAATLVAPGPTPATPAKVLFIVSNADSIGHGHPAGGNYLNEVAYPYNALASRKHEIQLASPKGGQMPIDQGSRERFKDDAECNRFLSNRAAMVAVNNTLRLDQLNGADYSVVFYPGGYGPVADLTDCPPAAKVTAAAYEAGGHVAAICHGPAGLLNVRLSNGDFLVKGKRLTALSNAEEEAHGMADHVPYMLETKLIEAGALYEKATPGAVRVVVDQRLVTGQNAESSSEFAKVLVKLLG